MNEASEAGARAMYENDRSNTALPSWETAANIICEMYRKRTRLALEAAFPALLAAGWVPPEEAEARLRGLEQVDAVLAPLLDVQVREESTREIQWERAVGALHVRAENAEARVRVLEASWVPPERVETIDCPRAEHGFQEHGAGPPASWVCPTCKNSGKLEIVTAE